MNKEEKNYLPSFDDFIIVELDAKKFSKYVDDNCKKISCVFDKMTVGKLWEIENETKIKSGKDDYIEIKRTHLRKMLKEWNLNIELEIVNGEISDRCFQKIEELPYGLISGIISAYMDTFSINDKEEKEIEKQASILFAKNSKGVQNPHEAITLYCVLGSFWEKFGINRFDMKKLSLKEFRMLRMISVKEGEMKEVGRGADKPKVANVAGSRGKVSPSRGVVVPMPGSPGAQ